MKFACIKTKAVSLRTIITILQLKMKSTPSYIYMLGVVAASDIK